MDAAELARSSQTSLTKAAEWPPEGGPKEKDMSYSHYDDRDLYWEARLSRALRGKEGFAWGAFLIGFILGGIIF